MGAQNRNIWRTRKWASPVGMRRATFGVELNSVSTATQAAITLGGKCEFAAAAQRLCQFAKADIRATEIHSVMSRGRMTRSESFADLKKGKAYRLYGKRVMNQTRPWWASDLREWLRMITSSTDFSLALRCSSSVTDGAWPNHDSGRQDDRFGGLTRQLCHSQSEPKSKRTWRSTLDDLAVSEGDPNGDAV
ncbi:hypothetical protein IMCC20628_03558 [Hoeflea sp. IMCC20628]|nr:hypothetical protein IMCC20628_03558 [Hoeflea sp. IMCC20628]